MATRKTTATKKTSAAKTTAKAAEKAVVEKAAEVKEAVAETVAEVKTAAVKKTDEAKEAVKKTAKKVTKKAADVTITVEFAGRQAVITDLAAKAEAAYKAINADAEINTLDIYVKPEENAAFSHGFFFHCAVKRTNIIIPQFCSSQRQSACCQAPRN